VIDALPLGIEADADKQAILRELRANGAMLRSVRRQKGARDALNYRQTMASRPDAREVVPQVAQAVADARHGAIHPIDWAAICLAAIASPKLDRFALERIALHLGAGVPVVQAAFGWLPAARPDGTMAANPFVMNLARLRGGYRLARPVASDERAALDLFLAGRDPALSERLIDARSA
jgi:hypothetical protein